MTVATVARVPGLTGNTPSQKKSLGIAALLAISLCLASCSGSAPPVTGTESDPGKPVVSSPEIESLLTVRVTEDFAAYTSEQSNISADVRQAGMPATLDSVSWSQLDGPGQAQIARPDALQTTVVFDLAGQYTLQLTAYQGGQTGTDTLHVSVTDLPVNAAPVADAGDNQQIKLDEVLNLQGAATDDGLPASQLSTEWSQTGGPGTATFSEPGALLTQVTFNAPGTYMIKLTATDGELTASDQLQVIVNDTQPDTGDPLNAPRDWQLVQSSDGSKPQARHEAGGVAWNDQLLLLGGRGKRAVNSYDANQRQWKNLGTPNKEMHHFQPVVYDNRIYILGALDRGFPSESVHRRIQVFNPVTRQWSEGDELPANRRRGSAGTVVYNNRIYMVGGTTNGHDGGTVNWFDEYDPRTGRWKTLPNAPTPRDHFYAAVVGDRLVAAGGRQTAYPATFENLVRRVDVYNFSTGQWESNAPAIPQARAGAMVVAHGPEVVVIGGETASAGPASNRVDAYNVVTRKWRRLKSLRKARHGGGAAIINSEIHVASGNLTRGGGNETTTQEKLELR